MDPRSTARSSACLFLLALAFAALDSNPAFARFNLAEDAPATLTRDDVAIEVARDGSFVEEESREVLIRNEAGRQIAGTTRIVYNARVSKVEVLSAETVLGGKVLPVPPEAIENKPVATNLPGFDEHAMITIPYTAVQVGSSIRIRKRTTQREVAFPGHYSRAFFPGTDLACEHFHLTIRSKRPLHVAVNDPDEAFEVEHFRDGDTDTLRVNLKKPVYRYLVEELRFSYLPASRLPYVQVSTDDSLERPAASVVEAGKLRKDHVPFPPSEAGVARGTGTYVFTPDGNAKITGRIELLGQQAVWLTGVGRYAAPETVKFAILRGISEGRRVVSGTVGDFDMRSPVVRNISIDVATEVEGAAIRTTAGLAYRLEHDSLKAYSVIDPEKYQGDLFLGFPNVTESVDRIAGSRLVGINPAPCRVNSPWIDASWETSEDGDSLLVTSRVTLKKPLLTHAEIAGQAFADLQKGIRHCFVDYALVFEPRTGN